MGVLQYPRRIAQCQSCLRWGWIWRYSTRDPTCCLHCCTCVHSAARRRHSGMSVDLRIVHEVPSNSCQADMLQRLFRWSFLTLHVQTISTLRGTGHSFFCTHLPTAQRCMVVFIMISYP